MARMQLNGWSRRLRWGVMFALVCLANVLLSNLRSQQTTFMAAHVQSTVNFQEPDITVASDPSKVLTVEACSRCHSQESQVWKNTPHSQTFEELHRNPRANEIAGRMGARSVKRNDICIKCHYTGALSNNRVRVVSGVSCESCHGPGRDWITVHSDFGGPGVSRDSESAAHKEQRLARASALGMRNPQNTYNIARSCLECHTVPNEELVNHGGHIAGSAEFEFVSWSQGTIRHRFLDSRGQYNATRTAPELRVMYIVGQLADLEFSTRAVAHATQHNRYGVEAAQRAARVARRLYEIYQLIENPILGEALMAFSTAELKTNNRQALLVIAEQIRASGVRFAEEAEGGQLAEVDRWLPDASAYR